MTNYLYGASVKGIQDFIFSTNKLKEIIGGSYLVDNICQDKFRSFCKEQEHEVVDDNIIMSAAGNIKYLVDKETCEKIVHCFPLEVSKYAPGVTISQAVVETTGDIKKDIDTLEKKLNTQRNKLPIPLDMGFMSLERARKSGGVASNYYPDKEGGAFVDKPTNAKICERKESLLGLFENFAGQKVRVKDVPWDMDDMTNDSNHPWVAIIHADGNGLGLLLQELAQKITDNEQATKAFKAFSKKLDDATKEATQAAFKKVITGTMKKEIEKGNKRYPIRPVVLGGDDLTLIIRADLALNFTIEYLKEFENRTKVQFEFLKEKYGVEGFENGITACAGIAYIKKSYPFHYGVHLAESLTAEAKKKSKSEEAKAVFNSNIPPSSLSFYKVQSSFTEDLQTMKDRTLFAKKSKVRLDYGPYFIHSKGGFAHVEELQTGLIQLNTFSQENSKGVSKLRNWISLLYEDKSKADFLMDRMEAVNSTFYKELNLIQERKKSKTILFELIQLHSFKNTKNEYTI